MMINYFIWAFAFERIISEKTYLEKARERLNEFSRIKRNIFASINSIEPYMNELQTEIEIERIIKTMNLKLKKLAEIHLQDNIIFHRKKAEIFSSISINKKLLAIKPTFAPYYQNTIQNYTDIIEYLRSNHQRKYELHLINLAYKFKEYYDIFQMKIENTTLPISVEFEEHIKEISEDIYKRLNLIPKPPEPEYEENLYEVLQQYLFRTLYELDIPIDLSKGIERFLDICMDYICSGHEYGYEYEPFAKIENYCENLHDYDPYISKCYKYSKDFENLTAKQKNEIFLIVRR